MKQLIELLLAEGEGFKPPIPEKGIPDFESSAIVHSANLPSKRRQCEVYFDIVEREEGQLELNLPSKRRQCEVYFDIVEREEGQLGLSLPFLACKGR